MIRRWVPWRLLLRRTASAYGLIDPVDLLARLKRFSQPAEVQEPIELLRAGIVFHARGAVNAKAIQHNLDWAWPWWVERQFNPADEAFIPRGFAISHVNLTHRNWTAVGLPDRSCYPIVDPRGLVTPLFDGWSLDFWLLGDEVRLLPSREEQARQILEMNSGLAVRTLIERDGLSLSSRASVVAGEEGPELRIELRGSCGDGGGRLVAALRPFNPEGVQFIERASFLSEERSFLVNGRDRVRFGETPATVHFSDYAAGDVLHRLEEEGTGGETECATGMATAAAVFAVPGGSERTVTLTVPLEEETCRPRRSRPAPRTWPEALEGCAALCVPDERVQFLYDAALRTLVLLSADEAFPGPYTYRRFWFRDACLMMNALLAAGFTERVRRLIEEFPARQQRNGYFLSQKGEWDSNGQVLWLCERYVRCSGRSLPRGLLESCLRGAAWIRRKRLPRGGEGRHGGLLPAGFSAEHFGPNDYYYWDDFWAVAGLRAAARLAEDFRPAAGPATLGAAAEELLGDTWKSIRAAVGNSDGGVIPASPYRRPDAGAVGSLVADYPLGLTPPDDPMIGGTVEFIVNNCFFGGGFFQDIIHSGINPYLTLAVAQTLLRRGDGRCRDLVDTVAQLASPTGQWPEAIHPRTGGGCMGDGQHGWAAAEWVMMVRNLFVREEGGGLVIGGGLFPSWLDGDDGAISFGPTPTPWGPFSVFLRRGGDGEWSLRVDGDCRRPAFLRIAVPGHRADAAADREGVYRLEREPGP